MLETRVCVSAVVYLLSKLQQIVPQLVDLITDSGIFIPGNYKTIQTHRSLSIPIYFGFFLQPHICKFILIVIFVCDSYPGNQFAS